MFGQQVWGWAGMKGVGARHETVFLRYGCLTGFHGQKMGFHGRVGFVSWMCGFFVDASVGGLWGQKTTIHANFHHQSLPQYLSEMGQGRAGQAVV